MNSKFPFLSSLICCLDLVPIILYLSCCVSKVLKTESIILHSYALCQENSRHLAVLIEK